VSEGHNQHVRDVHFKKSKKDVSRFNANHHSKDLIHSAASHDWSLQMSKKDYNQLLEDIPDQLTNTRKMLPKLLRQMYNNFEYYS